MLWNNIITTEINDITSQTVQSLKRKKHDLEEQIRLAVEDRNTKICKTEALRDRGEAILSTVVELADWIAALKVCYLHQFCGCL